VRLAAHSWWTAFNDPQLDRLMEQALAANPTLVQARRAYAKRSH
jgi:outer membrane protein TolC